MVPEKRIMDQLDLLLDSSEPGASLHHLDVLTAAGPAGPLGQWTDEQLEWSRFTIAPVRVAVKQLDVEKFIAECITAAAVDLLKKRLLVVWAGLNAEVWRVPVVDDLARRLRRERRLFEHPAAAEVTVVYAACRDGRRWTGQKWLTGELAGRAEQVQTLVGAPGTGEGMISAAPLVRKLVGLR